MNLLIRVNRILIALVLTATCAVAQTPEDLQELVLTGDLNGRSSVDFRPNARNITSLIPEGSEGTVLETRRLSRTGSYGIKVRITKVTERKGIKNVAKVGDETWVYFSQKDPWLTLKDRMGTEVEDPELALISKAKKDTQGMANEPGVAAPKLPTKEEVLREQKPVKRASAPSQDPNLAKESDKTKTAATFCVDCSAKKETTAAENNRSDIKDVKAEIEKLAPDEKWATFPNVLKYAASEGVENSIQYGIRNKEPRTKKLCYRYVKRALLGSGMVEDYLPGSKARHAVGDLKRRGYINMMEDPRYKDLIKNPQDAPKGAVLVYKNTKNKYHAGHAEIKTDWGSKGGYVSDFYRTTKQPLYDRELIGVMIKETP